MEMIDYGITPEQYHACLNRLWDALGNPDQNSDDVFTRIIDKLEATEADLKITRSLSKTAHCPNFHKHTRREGPCQWCDERIKFFREEIK